MLDLFSGFDGTITYFVARVHEVSAQIPEFCAKKSRGTLPRLKNTRIDPFWV